jgi:hypothetical protein
MKIFLIISVGIFGGLHLWNSVHSLSLKHRTEKLNIEQIFGFYQHEKTVDGREFRWTRSYGGLALRVEKPVILIPLHASHPDISNKPVKVKVYIIKDFFAQKRLLDEIVINTNSWNTYQYSLPECIGQDIILLLRVNRTWNPLKTRGSPDPRNLGVALGRIEFIDDEIHRCFF